MRVYNLIVNGKLVGTYGTEMGALIARSGLGPDAWRHNLIEVQRVWTKTG